MWQMLVSAVRIFSKETHWTYVNLSTRGLFSQIFLWLCRPVTARSVRLQAGHGPFGGRHRQPHHSSNPQPRCQQQIPRHLHHPVYTGHNHSLLCSLIFYRAAVLFFFFPYQLTNCALSNFSLPLFVICILMCQGKCHCVFISDLTAFIL